MQLTVLVFLNGPCCRCNPFKPSAPAMTRPRTVYQKQPSERQHIQALVCLKPCPCCPRANNLALLKMQRLPCMLQDGHVAGSKPTTTMCSLYTPNHCSDRPPACAPPAAAITHCQLHALSYTLIPLSALQPRLGELQLPSTAHAVSLRATC